MSKERKIYATFFGNEQYPVEWKDDAEKDLMWFYDDLHCPNPISPLYYDVGGWWGTSCEYMYRRFGAPIGSNWIAKKINGYVYTAIVPPTTPPHQIGGLFEYYNKVMPIYADTFLDRWNGEYIPNLKKWAKFMINFDWKNASIPEMLIHMEDCLDLQLRAFEIHWILNLAQVQASGEFQAVYNELIPEDPDDDFPQITISNHDRNWDSLHELWDIKEAIMKSPELKQLFLDQSVEVIMKQLRSFEGGESIFEMFEAYREEYGFKAMYTHEYIYPTWYEDPTPIYSAVKSYVESDYDYLAHYEGCMKSQSDAIARARSKISDPDDLKRFNEKLELCLKMMPLTPDHHFYIDQAIYASMRIMFLEIGKAYAAAGKLDDPEDIFMLEYEDVRCLGATDDYPGKEIAAKNRAMMVAADDHVPRYWYGTVDHWQLYEEVYKQALWGYPEIFEKEMRELEANKPISKMEVKGVGGSAGVVEGFARVVATPAEFDQIQHGDIMICRMTNPGWIISFSKISGLVTDTGGVLSHPAVVSREFGIPCVVGTTRATRIIHTGDRIRVDGNTGLVEILEKA